MASFGPGDLTPLSAVSVGGAILAGGQSRRFGSNKSLALVSGQPLGAKVATAVRDAGIDPVVVIGGTAEAALELGLILVPDQFPGEGPLGGTATALSYFTGSHVLVAACDLPLVDRSTIEAVAIKATIGRASIAAVDGVPQISLACWPCSMYRPVLGAIRSGERRWGALTELVDYDLVEVAEAAMADADDPETLANLIKTQAPDAGGLGGRGTAIQ